MAKKKRHSRVKIATKLAQANDLTTQGKLQSESARTLGVSVMTLRRWRKADEGRGVPRFSARQAVIAVFDRRLGAPARASPLSRTPKGTILALQQPGIRRTSV